MEEQWAVRKDGRMLWSQPLRVLKLYLRRPFGPTLVLKEGVRIVQHVRVELGH